MRLLNSAYLTGGRPLSADLPLPRGLGRRPRGRRCSSPRPERPGHWPSRCSRSGSAPALTRQRRAASTARPAPGRACTRRRSSAAPPPVRPSGAAGGPCRRGLDGAARQSPEPQETRPAVGGHPRRHRARLARELNTPLLVGAQASCTTWPPSLAAARPRPAPTPTPAAAAGRERRAPAWHTGGARWRGRARGRGARGAGRGEQPAAQPGGRRAVGRRRPRQGRHASNSWRGNTQRSGSGGEGGGGAGSGGGGGGGGERFLTCVLKTRTSS